MAKIEAELIGEHKDVLRISVEDGDGHSKGVDVQWPAEPATITAACSVLMTSLAGVSQSELELAALMALAA